MKLHISSCILGSLLLGGVVTQGIRISKIRSLKKEYTFACAQAMKEVEKLGSPSEDTKERIEQLRDKIMNFK